MGALDASDNVRNVVMERPGLRADDCVGHLSPMCFSMIIPAHSAAAFIGKALDSVLMQGDPDYEILVVADKCTDDTADIARARCVHVIESNGGAPRLARNAGLDQARGDYWLFLDADDYMLINSAFRRISDAIDETGDPQLLHYGFMWGPKPFGGLQTGGGHWHHVWSRAWHRNAIGETRMPPLLTGEDTVFTMGMMNKRGLTHAVYEFPLMQHVTDRSGSVTHTHLAKKSRGDSSMMARLDDMLHRAMHEARRLTVLATR